MKSRILQLIILIFVTTVLGYGQSNSWNGITPLRSTRSDVEKILGNPTATESCCNYENEERKVSITYLTYKCQNGWDVPQNTVLEITVYSRSDSNKSFEELKLDRTKFQYAVDDALYGTWTNADEGVQYYFSQASQFLRSKSYIPKKSDNNLRCDGFPLFDPVSESYYRAEIMNSKNWADIAVRFEAYVYDVKESKNEYKCYFIFYEGQDFSGKKFKTFLKRVKNTVYKIMNANPDQIKIIEGGRREEFSIIAFVLPNEWQAPTPMPTLPSPQFMRKK